MVSFFNTPDYVVTLSSPPWKSHTLDDVACPQITVGSFVSSAFQFPHTTKMPAFDCQFPNDGRPTCSFDSDLWMFCELRVLYVKYTMVQKTPPYIFWIDNSVEDKLISIFFVYGILKKFGTRIYAHFIHLTSRMQPQYLEKIKSYWALTCLRSLNSFVYFLTEEKLFTVAVLITDKMVWYLH